MDLIPFSIITAYLYLFLTSLIVNVRSWVTVISVPTLFRCFTSNGDVNNTSRYPFVNIL